MGRVSVSSDRSAQKRRLVSRSLAPLSMDFSSTLIHSVFIFGCICRSHGAVTNSQHNCDVVEWLSPLPKHLCGDVRSPPRRCEFVGAHREAELNSRKVFV